VLPATDAALPATGNVLPAGRKCIRHRRRSRDKRVHRGSF
jgi:hypothetical protein